MITLLALASAMVFGAGDFCGGAAARRADDLRVLLISLPTGLALLLAGALAGGGLGHAGAAAWGAAAGLIGTCGLLVFYRALAAGPMSVVAPISGLMAALVPAVAGLARGDRMGPAGATGIALCLVAICFVSAEKNAEPMRLTGGPALAAFAGACFGVFFVFIRLGDDGTVWPLVSAKAVGLLVVLPVAAIAGRRPATLLRDRVAAALALLTGVLDVLGNALYVFAAREGMLSVAGVLSSLYPASTVLLARIVYRERLRPIQRLGLVVAIAGVGLVTTG